MNKYVFSFWSGPKYYLIEILAKLMKYHSNGGKNYTLVYLNEETLKDWIDLHPKFHTLSLTHKADYIRVNLIYKYGGVWIDADTIVMNNLNELFDIIKNNNGFYMKENNDLYVNGVFGSVKEHRIIKEIKEEIDEKLNDLTTTISWSFIGSQVFNPILLKYNDFYILNGLDTIYPVNYDVAKELLLDSRYDNYNKYVKDFQPLFVLVNSVYKNFNTKNVLQENAPINYFLKESIKNIQEYNYESTFNIVYDLCLWNDNNVDIPQSGPGSALKNTKTVRDFINNVISKYDIKNVVDLGCGDLTWIKITNAFNIEYTGIDIVESLIKKNKLNHIDKNFYCKNIIVDELPSADLFIIRDVIFHLKIRDVIQLLENIKSKYKYLLIGNNRVLQNLDDMNVYHFNQRNLFAEPFNCNKKAIRESIDEVENGRDFILVDSSF